MLNMEYSDANLGDQRLNARLRKLGARLAQRPGESLPKLCTTEAELAGAYRFLNHEDVTLEKLLEPHIRATRLRSQAVSEPLVLHDSTKLKYGGSTRAGMELDAGGETQSFLAHLSLCASLEPRDVLGLLQLSSFRVPNSSPSTPDGKAANKAAVEARRKAKPKQLRLSSRWLDAVRSTQALLSGLSPIHVMDREADDYELFACMKREHIRFVARANFDRLALCDRIRMTSQLLLEIPAQANRTLHLNARKATKKTKLGKAHPPREARWAQVELGATKVRVKRPKDASRALPQELELNLVFVREPNPPQGVEPVEWRLWTTEPIDTPEQVLRVVDIYVRRWLIEEYIKALKTGCRVQERELETREGLTKLLGLMAPVAWHMVRLREWTREAPQARAAELLPPGFLEVLQQVAVRYPLPPNPTVEQALVSIAGVGGHLKRNGPPGFITLAKGYQELLLLTRGYELARQRLSPANSSFFGDVSNR